MIPDLVAKILAGMDFADFSHNKLVMDNLESSLIMAPDNTRTYISMYFEYNK